MTLNIKSIALAGCLGLSVLTPAWPVFADSAAHAAPTRRVAIDGSNNFRDIGGYATEDGHHVRWGVIYRSAAMNQITPAGFAQIKALGIKTNFDFRSTDERAVAPVTWPADMGMTVHAVDYKMDMSAFMTVFARGNVTADQAKGVMVTLYKDLPFTFAPQYKDMLRAIINGQTPLVYNCSAGKDRTGVATAILLTLAGASRQTVSDDYLLSNTYYVPQKPQPGQPTDRSMAFFMTLPADVQKAIMGVDASYLDSAFSAIEHREGGWQRYVHQDLGLTDGDIAILKTRLTE